MSEQEGIMVAQMHFRGLEHVSRKKSCHQEVKMSRGGGIPLGFFCVGGGLEFYHTHTHTHTHQVCVCVWRGYQALCGYIVRHYTFSEDNAV